MGQVGICYWNGTTWVPIGTADPLPVDIFTAALASIWAQQSSYVSSVGAFLVGDLDTGLYGGRTYVEIWVKSSGAATFTVYASRNNSDWRNTGLTIVLAGAGEGRMGFLNAYRYIRVSTPAANNNEIEIVSSR